MRNLLYNYMYIYIFKKRQVKSWNSESTGTTAAAADSLLLKRDFIYFLDSALPDKINAPFLFLFLFCIPLAHSIPPWKMKRFPPACAGTFVWKSVSQDRNSTNFDLSHLDGLEPARLFDLIVNDRLVLCNSLISSTREDHVLQKRHWFEWKQRRSKIPHYLCNWSDVAEAEVLSRSQFLFLFLVFFPSIFRWF